MVTVSMGIVSPILCSPSISLYVYASSLTLSCKAKTIHQFTKSSVYSKSLEEAMGSTSQLVPLPLLANDKYTASTIPWRFPSDDPHIPTATELSWINLLHNTIPTFKKHAESDASVPDAADKAETFAQRYARILEDFKKDPAGQGEPLDIFLLCRLREQVLRELGFSDIFKKIKDVENTNAMSLFENVVRLNDAIEDEEKRLENLVRGIFAGNIFDLGATQLAEAFSKDGVSFLSTCQNLVPRPWIIDDLETFKVNWSKKSWKKVIIFVDNSGADIILGILPFARELLRRGSQVILAANELPSLNDVTYSELTEIISRLKDEEGCLMGVSTSNLLIANSGNELPIIDLTRVSQELAYLTNDVDLVILEGMGRGIETNLYAQFKCDSLKIAMVKHTEVAEFLGSRLYDCVIKYDAV
ncbi:damage-control phosphatase At2g17340-like isoform X1 [Vigna umbellata]|uniref:damage-control phosphatase At2g17340-like isoform X1 n=1 Tax=Vigna umbellata TaxID=87088 RepID=UPI001F5F2563|nr:damage-control phosphatase At2g17340-like isoform X1 [Vigna umbellata]